MPRPDPTVLLGNLIAGALLLLVPASMGAWVLALIGAAYVGVASVFLAVVYTRDSLSTGRELLTWVVPWLAVVALWTWMATDAENGTPSPLLDLWLGLAIGTGCYLAWQLAALVVRRMLSTLGPTLSR